jgi:hypothetical protein
LADKPKYQDMKKSILLFVLIMAAVAVNAQRIVVKTADLPKAIIENVAKDYAGFTVKEAVKVVADNVVTYEVVVAKGTTMETLLYDKDGKFVKKLTVKAGTTVKKAQAATSSAPVKK